MLALENLLPDLAELPGHKLYAAHLLNEILALGWEDQERDAGGRWTSTGHVSQAEARAGEKDALEHTHGERVQRSDRHKELMARDTGTMQPENAQAHKRALAGHEADYTRRLRAAHRENHAKLAKAQAESFDPKKGLYGATAPIDLAGGTKMTARYKLVEADSLTPSHDFRGGGVSKRADYPTALQPRDYSGDKSEAAKVYHLAGAKAQGLFVNTSTSATDGPPSVSKDGNVVINGNGRAMALQYSAHKGENAWYTDKLKLDAGHYGFSPEQVGKFKAPVLVREVDMHSSSPEAHTFARAGNVTTTASQTPTRLAASMSGLIPDNVIHAIQLDDPDTTLGEVLNKKEGAGFRGALQRAVSESAPGKVAEYFRPNGQLTEYGRTFATDTLLSKHFPNPETIENFPDGIKRTLTESLPQLTELKKEYPEQHAALQEALKYHHAALEDGEVTHRDYQEQSALGFAEGDKLKLTAPGETMLSLVSDAGNKPRVFRERLTRFLREAREGAGLMGGDVHGIAKDALTGPMPTKRKAVEMFDEPQSIAASAESAMNAVLEFCARNA